MDKSVHFGGSYRTTAPVVVATATVNGLAYDSHQSWAFWRADGSALVGTPFRLHTGERATMAVVRSLDPRMFGADRMCTLLQATLMHIETSLADLAVAGRAAVFLAANEHFAEATDPYFGRWQRRLEQEAGQWLQKHGQLPDVRVFAFGHAGFAHALLEAARSLEDESVDLAIVGGVDTYYDPLRFDILEEQERIFDQSRTDSFVPGEGAALCVLTRPALARQSRIEPLAALRSVAVAEEPAPMFSDRPCTARGLSRAMRAITQRLKADHQRLEWVIDDMTNESYRSRELMLALPRALAPGGLDTAGQDYRQIAADGLRVDHLPECFGDLGAATLPTALSIAAQAFLRGDPAAGNCMITGSSTGVHRGVIFVQSGGGA